MVDINNYELNYKKLDEDDIIEIILEHFQEVLENSELASGMLLGSAGNDLRFIGIFGNENDANINSCDLIKLDKEKEFNGDHQFLKNNQQFNLSPANNDPE